MRKIGLLSLALVLALGALGAAYAPWMDQVEIKQVVHTGSLEVGVFGEAWLEGDTKGVASITVTHGDWKFDKVFDDYPYPFYESVTVAIDNFYPCVYAHEFFAIGVGGTVPVHLMVDMTVDDPDGMFDHLTLDWWIYIYRDGEPIDLGSGEGMANGELDVIEGILEEVQLYPCDALVIYLEKHLAQSGPQDATASFTMDVTAYQYNWTP